MRATELDFLPTGRPVPFIAWLLFALGAGMLALVVNRYSEVSAEQVQAAEHAERIARQQSAGKPRKTVSKAGSTAGQADAALLDLDWGRLFFDLEEMRPDHIAFIAIRADGRKTQAVIEAESRTSARMLDFLDVLRAQPGFSEVALTSHSTEEDNPQQPLRFEARLNWGRP